MAVIHRVIPEGSYVEVAARKKRLRCDLRARFYFSDEKRRFIISTVSGIAETGDPTVLPEDVSDDELGRVVCDHLLAFDPKTPASPPGNKTDWPAYRASGARSVTSFESHSWQVLVETVGDSIRVNAAPLKTLHHEISVEGIARPDHASLGAAIRRALAGAVALRERNLI
jgi:hypothetical protein